MNKLIKSHYQDVDITFAENGWINATGIAEKFGKRLDNWLANKETQEYIAALEEGEDSGLHPWNSRDTKKGKQNQAIPNTWNSRYLKTRRGNNGGAWLHPDLAVFFARWLDVRFAIWCDRQIKALLSGQHPHHDRKRLRHEASSSFKIMNAMLKMQRQNQGKEVASHHFSNEAKLINWALTGKFDAIDHKTLEENDLDRLARLEVYNTLLIGHGLDYDERKKALEDFAADGWMPRIAAAKPVLERRRHV